MSLEFRSSKKHSAESWIQSERKHLYSLTNHTINLIITQEEIEIYIFAGGAGGVVGTGGGGEEGGEGGAGEAEL